MRTEVEGDRNLDAVLDAIVAVLEAQRGHFAAARELCARSRESFEDLGLELQLVSLHTYAGLVELLAGDPAAAERELRQGYQALERMGERGRLSTTDAFLARALYEQGNLDEAERYATITESSASADDVISQAVWRQTQARVLAATAARPGRRWSSRAKRSARRRDGLRDAARRRAARARRGARSGRRGQRGDRLGSRGAAPVRGQGRHRLGGARACLFRSRSLTGPASKQ